MAKKKNKERASNTSSARADARPLLRRVLLNVLAVALLASGLGTGLFYLQRHVERNLTFPARPPEVVLVNRPAWMSDALAAEIISAVRPLGTHSSFDHPLLVSRAAILNNNPWIKRVNSVRRAYGQKPGDTIEIDCDYRAPVALVHWEDYFWLIDGDAVKLPEQFKADQINRILIGPDGRPNLRVIEGVRQPPVESGRTWPGEDLQAGLDLVKLLHGQAAANEILAVDVSNYAGRIDPKDAQLVLRTRYDTQIHWGRPINTKDFFVEIPASRKLERLAALVQQYGRVDAGRPWVDIRFETVTHPIASTAEGPSAGAR